MEKYVTIRLSDNNRIPAEIKSEITKRIGSKFDRVTKDVLIGLEHEERKYILPYVIVNNEDNKGLDWRIKVRNYFSNLIINVPFGEDGLKLNIATEKRWLNTRIKRSKSTFQ